jgi:molybdate transport system substrate-binding protein
MTLHRLIRCTAWLCALYGLGASGAELTLFSSTGVEAAMRELAPQFERASGHKLTVRYGATNALKAEIEQGGRFDVAIMTTAAEQTLTQEGKLKDAENLGRSGVGIAVPAGAPKPDIHDTEALKRTLLAAKSVAFSSNGASGLYFAGLLQRLGIADAINAKAQRPEGSVGELLAKGGSNGPALGVQQISELLPVQGIQFVGPLPPELQNYTLFAAGQSPQTASADAARALLTFLVSPQAQKVYKAKGLELP